MKYLRIIIFLLLFAVAGRHAQGQIKLPGLISNGMVLQQNEQIKLWGWASANESITLYFNEEAYRATANAEGGWEILLPPQTAGGPHSMLFQGKNRVEVNDIYFGEVWLASGQSNMELTMERVKFTYPEVIENAGNANIRQFLVPDIYDFKKEREDLESGEWIFANPESVLDFSAVAYFFALNLYAEYQVPVGIINAALGGSPVEAWMSEAALKKFPEAHEELQRFKNDSLIAQIENLDRERSSAWYTTLDKTDLGLNNSPKWYETNLDDSGWKTMQIPGFWNDGFPEYKTGVYWFRKEIDVPASMAGKPAMLWVGRIVDQDFVYLNGELVGTTGYQYPPRIYGVDASAFKAGKNLIAVRVVNQSGKGGFIPDKPYFFAADGDTLQISGEWKFKKGADMPPLSFEYPVRWRPAGLYNSMIHPLHKYAIKGVIWYQGESNTRNPAMYARTFPAMIDDWRQRWDRGNFPFLYVQLANFMETNPEPMESEWAELRQAQLQTLSTPNTGMAVTIDLGEWNDIHPLNKKDVGERLYLLAQKLAYGQEQVIACSPQPESAEFSAGNVQIQFQHTGDGLISSDGEALRHFAVSADGETFVWAQAEISGNTVRVWSEGVANPVAVRYAWAHNPENVNLYSKNGLPATPFEIRKQE